MNREAFSKRVRRLAQLGICVQFLALIRTLAEFFSFFWPWPRGQKDRCFGPLFRNPVPPIVR